MGRPKFSDEIGFGFIDEHERVDDDAAIRSEVRSVTHGAGFEELPKQASCCVIHAAHIITVLGPVKRSGSLWLRHATGNE